MAEQVRERIQDRRNTADVVPARVLGAFGLGLGGAQVAAPRLVARAAGVDDHRQSATIIRSVGAREVAQGLGLVWTSEPTPFLWSRVGGDAFDLSLLVVAIGTRSGRRHARVLASMIAVGAISVVDVVAAVRSSRARRTRGRRRRRVSAEVTAAVTIRRSPEDLYRFWRRFTNLPAFMTAVESVEDRGDGRIRWRATGPAGRSVEWVAEVVEDVPNRRIEWRAVEGVPIAGAISFTPAPDGRGTEVRLRLAYGRPGRLARRVAAPFVGTVLRQQVRDDLRRFKQLMETGEVIRSEGSPEGARTARLLAQRPAQPFAA